MKLWLDDERRPPNNTWKWVVNGHDFYDWLHSDWRYDIEAISFDHDIATFDAHGNEITGYRCVCWVERLVHTDPEFKVPRMTVHSANPVGRRNIQRVIDALSNQQRLF